MDSKTHASDRSPETRSAPEGPQASGDLVVVLGDTCFLTPVLSMLETLVPAPVVAYDLPDSRAHTPAATCVIAVADSTHPLRALVREAELRDENVHLVLLMPQPEADECMLLAQHRRARMLAWPATASALTEAVRAALARSRQLGATRAERTRLQVKLQKLTERERQVLALIQDGHSSKSIAGVLQISKRTVDDHRSSLLHKTGCSTAAALGHAVDRIELLRERERMLASGDWGADERAAPTPEPALDAGNGFGQERPRPTLPAAADSRHVPDIAERRCVGKRLRESEQSEDPCCLLDQDLRMSWANPAWLHHGREDRELAIQRSATLGARYLDTIPRPLRSWYAARLTRCLETGRAWEHEYLSSSPIRRQNWSLAATPFGRSLFLTHSLRASFRQDVALEFENGGTSVADAEVASIEHCAACRRVRVQGRTWRIAPSALGPDPGGPQWTLCPQCQREYVEAPEREIAEGP